ncbi:MULTISPECIES: S9 family peptidase [Pseudonocardia]|uniref:Prolyl tripeptidyl peptidase n=2 Tax=Pseudonocardia TaxID=1847 RepID=A0A1Y2MJ36_PSEAH|nr:MULTISPECIES: S9 family peptidase [Pseudonocardia]OSY35285.1 Prolyl tripeptidyl peptidase precursor [Pseudonocardia autotrophica]TDN73276.1 dipeptidyl aminopeptidase/acylaminoacyl peptidase [Pseudonocardia autotrophica]BBG04012.1 putative peptidase [Pseudonocardia autotrophica]GEC27736.1 putative peptidase [Pseudonocardia saturnea]
MSVTGRPTDQRPALIDVEALFADPEFSSPSISPDGTRIAYLAPAHGRRNVWVRGVDQEHTDAVLVTHDERRGISSYFWSDDPRWLLYLQDDDGNEDWHLYRVDLDRPDEPAVDLTPLEPGSRVFAVDSETTVPGTAIIWMNPRPLFVDVFRIDLGTGEITPLVERTDPADMFFVDRTGSAAWHVARADDGSYEISAADPDTGERRVLHRAGGPEHPVGLFLYPLPDGTGALLGDYHDSDDLRLLRLDRETGELTVVAAVDGHSLDTLSSVADTLPPTVFADRRTGGVIAARFTGDRPLIVPIDPHFAEVQAALEKLTDGVLGTVSSDLDGQRWIVTFIHDRQPVTTWFYDHSTGDARQVSGDRTLDPAGLAPTTAVSFPARDGLPLHGFLTLPVGVEPSALPLVLLVHGGPWMHDTWGFNRTVQFLANRGYAVLQVNFRGSTGYGRRHITAAIGEFARAMHDDLIDGADWAVAQGWADPARLGIAGGSYGGYAALVGVTVTPEKFAAAVDYVGISDLANFLATLPPFVRANMTNNWIAYVGDPDDPEQLAEMGRRSPITMVDRIRTPLLVAQGANDVRVVQAESDNIVAPLRERGVPVEYIVADDEGHGFENPENQVLLHRAIERHLAEHLGGRRAE